MFKTPDRFRVMTWHFERLEPSGTIVATEPSGESHVVKNGDMNSLAGGQLLEAMISALCARAIERAISAPSVQPVALRGDPQEPPDVPQCCGGKADCDAFDYCAGRVLPVADERGATKGLHVLNALEVLERMDYRAGDRVLVENFLRIMGERGMWVIENRLASPPLADEGQEQSTGGVAVAPAPTVRQSSNQRDEKE